MNHRIAPIVFALTACGQPDGAATPPAVAASSASAPATATAATSATAAAALPAPSVRSFAPPGSPPPLQCGPLECRRFSNARAAFDFVLASKPKVLGVGESHAPRGADAMASGAKRFETDLLPALVGKASDLLVELMGPPTDCPKKTEVVRKKQEVVTQKQATNNQNDYVALGEAARKAGVVPDLLRPACADLEAIDKSKDGAVLATLELIPKLTLAQATKTLEKRAAAGGEQADRMLVLYGGAMHNDLTPPPERASWSFGPALSAKVGGRYVEVDVFVREFIQDTESWKKLAWYPHFEKGAHDAYAELFTVGPGAFALVLPAAKPTSP